MMQSRTLCYCQHTAGDRRRCYNEPTTTTRRRSIELKWNSTAYCLFCIWIWMRIENWGLGIHTCVVSCLVLLLLCEKSKNKSRFVFFLLWWWWNGLGWAHLTFSHVFTNQQGGNERKRRATHGASLNYLFILAVPNATYCCGTCEWSSLNNGWLYKEKETSRRLLGRLLPLN